MRWSFELAGSIELPAPPRLELTHNSEKTESRELEIQSQITHLSSGDL